MMQIFKGLTVVVAVLRLVELSIIHFFVCKAATVSSHINEGQIRKMLAYASAVLVIAYLALIVVAAMREWFTAFIIALVLLLNISILPIFLLQEGYAAFSRLTE